MEEKDYDVVETNFTLVEYKSKKEKKINKKILIVFAIILSSIFGSIIGSVSTVYVMNDRIVKKTYELAVADLNAIAVSNNIDKSYLDKNNSNSNIIDEVEPSVVTIIIKDNKRSETYNGSGTGIIYDEDDQYIYIATNNHVINGASEVAIMIEGASNYIDANLVGTNPSKDLAIVSIQKSDLTKLGVTSVSKAVFADSDLVKTGDFVIAIGNSLGEGISATGGMVSVKSKDVDLTHTGETINVIQTDAPINPGNSGGPLVNMNGEVIGINTAKIIKSSKENVEGMGYSITSNEVVPTLEEIMNEKEKVFMGIKAFTITPELAKMNDIQEGVFVNEVYESTSAHDAGILKNDIIVGFDNVEITSMEQLSKLIKEKRIDDVVPVQIIRDDKKIDVDVKLKKRESMPFS